MYNYDKMTQEELLDLALNEQELAVRCDALEKITDQEAIKHIALNHVHWYSRSQAIERINDPDTLKQICV